MKQCDLCHMSKPLDSFKRNRLTPDGRTHVCTECLRARRGKAGGTPEERRERQLALIRERFRSDPAFVARTRDARRKSKYGILPEQFAALMESQGGVCAICGRPSTDGRSLHVDHCHQTATIRGLLCQPCNTAIGLFEEDPARFRAAEEYLKADALQPVVGPAPRVAAKCGSTSGYTRHRRADETPCPACLRAWSEYNSARKREINSGRPLKRRKVAVCGTHAGYTAHYTRHEKPCDACKEAKRQYLASRKAK